jgi:hypothetical protein
MKKYIFSLLLSGLAMLCQISSLQAQAICTMPTQMEKNEVVLCVGVKNGDFEISKISRRVSLFDTVKFRVLTTTSTPFLVSVRSVLTSKTALNYQSTQRQNFRYKEKNYT